MDLMFEVLTLKSLAFTAYLFYAIICVGDQSDKIRLSGLYELDSSLKSQFGFA